MTPRSRRILALAVFAVTSGLATLLWASRSGGNGITWGNLVTGCLTGLVITLIVNSMMKSTAHVHSARSTPSSQSVSPELKPQSTTKTAVVPTEELRVPADLSGDELWSRAVSAAESGRANHARAFFAGAIRKNPWKYCGVGRDSWKPSAPEHQAIWLEAMADAGLGEVANAILNPPKPAELTIIEMMRADRRVEEILEESCRRLGMSKSEFGEATPKESLGSLEVDAKGLKPDDSTSGAARWIEERLRDEHAWKFSLDRKHEQHLSSLSGDDLQVIMKRICSTLDTCDEYWKFCTCEMLLEPLGAKGESALPQLLRFLKHQNAPWRQETIRAIGNIGPGAASALHHLIDAQRDPDEHVRREAAKAIKKIGAAETTTHEGG